MTAPAVIIFAPDTQSLYDRPADRRSPWRGDEDTTGRPKTYVTREWEHDRQVEDLNKARGLDLSKPHGAQAEGLWSEPKKLDWLMYMLNCMRVIVSWGLAGKPVARLDVSPLVTDAV